MALLCPPCPAAVTLLVCGHGANAQVLSLNRELGPRFAIHPSLSCKGRLIQITKTGKFELVFRSGDKRASEVHNLLILTSTLQRFQRGSSTKRAVTTVGGATKIIVEAKLVTRNSQVIFERRVQGTVRLFGGENLKATQALAKNIAKLISTSSLHPNDSSPE